MGTMQEVVERLDETEKKAGEVIRQLEEAESLHKSLDETRKGLIALAHDVGELITITRKGVDELSDAVTAFRTVTETIQQSDTNVVATALKTMETRMEAIAGEICAITEIKTEVGELKEMVTRTAAANEKRTQAMIDNAVEEVSGQSLMGRVLGTRRKAKAKRNN